MYASHEHHRAVGNVEDIRQPAKSHQEASSRCLISHDYNQQPQLDAEFCVQEAVQCLRCTVALAAFELRSAFVTNAVHRIRRIID